MPRRTLVVLLLVTLNLCGRGAVAEDAPQLLHDAVTQGRASVQVTALGGSTGDTIVVAARSLGREVLTLRLAPGTVFQSSTGKVQNMVAARLRGERMGQSAFSPTHEIQLRDDQVHYYVVEAYCLDFHKPNPTAGDVFLLTPPSAELASLMSAALASGQSIQRVQAALWIKRDGVSDRELLARFPVTPSDLSAARAWLQAHAASGPAAKPDERGEVDPRQEKGPYVWKSKGPPDLPAAMGTKNIAIKEVLQDGRRETVLRFLADGNVAMVGSDMHTDLPGSTNIHIEIDPAAQSTEYAGLTFREECILSILRDFTLTATKGGVRARARGGAVWVSRELQRVNGNVYAFFPDSVREASTHVQPGGEGLSAAQLADFAAGAVLGSLWGNGTVQLNGTGLLAIGGLRTKSAAVRLACAVALIDTGARESGTLSAPLEIAIFKRLLNSGEMLGVSVESLSLSVGLRSQVQAILLKDPDVGSRYDGDPDLVRVLSSLATDAPSVVNILKLAALLRQEIPTLEEDFTRMQARVTQLLAAQQEAHRSLRELRIFGREKAGWDALSTVLDAATKEVAAAVPNPPATGAPAPIAWGGPERVIHSPELSSVGPDASVPSRVALAVAMSFLGEAHGAWQLVLVKPSMYSMDIDGSGQRILRRVETWALYFQNPHEMTMAAVQVGRDGKVASTKPEAIKALRTRLPDAWAVDIDRLMDIVAAMAPRRQIDASSVSQFALSSWTITSASGVERRVAWAVPTLDSQGGSDGTRTRRVVFVDPTTGSTSEPPPNSRVSTTDN